VLRNVCLMRIRRRRETPTGVVVELPDVAPGPEEALEAHVLRECIWHALDTLSPEERLTVVLRHFSRCTSYTAIGAVTAVPVGTVRSRLNRARTRLLEALLATPHDPPLRHAELESARREHWESFYQMVQERPVPLTYRDLFTPDVEVRDTGGCWHGIDDWSAEERAAITVGVRATVVGLLAGPDLTVVEVDFHNPAEWPDHCPPQATFVHRLRGGRSWGLRIHYPGVATTG
jgi:RNA polymerase sigma-70 factor (ECF subfamily)